MKSYRFLFFLILTLAIDAYALEPKIEIVERFDNLRMVAFIDHADLDNSPAWDPNQGNPPLSIGEAIQAVKSFIHDSTGSTPIREIELRRVPSDKSHWHYLIKITDKAMSTKYDIYVVLLNGKVVPAAIEPQSYK